MIGNFFKGALATARGATYGTGKYIGTGMRGIGKGAVAVGTVGLTIASEGNEYGTGYGAVKGAAYLYGPTGLALMGYDIAKGALEIGREHYNKNRKLEMFSPVPDLYGNVATIRQRSLSNLDRGRSILGSEAQMMR